MYDSLFQITPSRKNNLLTIKEKNIDINDWLWEWKSLGTYCVILNFTQLLSSKLNCYSCKPNFINICKYESIFISQQSFTSPKNCIVSNEHINTGNCMFIKHCELNSWWQQALQQINLQMLPSQCHRTTQEKIDFALCFAAPSGNYSSFLINSHLTRSSDWTFYSSQLDVP